MGGIEGEMDMDSPHRVMPSNVDLGRSFDGCIGEAISHWKHDEEDNTKGRRKVMGYFIPDWQRPLVWTDDQKVKLLESAWLGLPMGTYTFNRKWGSDYDNLLIDGQQRLWSFQCYLNDEFPVFGYRWSETTDIDKRWFRYGVKFGSYITETDDEDYLRNYYNMMNFGGTAHTEDQRA